MNIAVIGCGRVARKHAWAISRIPEAQIIAVCDVVSEKAREFAALHGYSRFTTDYRKLLDIPALDLFSICTPSGLHYEMAEACMNAGKHVLVEKPLTLKPGHAFNLFRKSQKADTVLGVVLQNRFNPPMQELKRLVGEMGKPLLINASCRWYRPQSYYEDSWHDDFEMAGGVLLNQAMHHIDALQWLMGDVKSVFAYAGTLGHEIESPDSVVAMILFKNGAFGTLEASTITWPQNIESSVTVFSERGSVKVGGTALNRMEFKAVGDAPLWRSHHPDPQDVYGEGHLAQYEEVIDAILEGRQPTTNAYEGLKSVRIADAMYQSAKTGKEIKL